MPIPLAQIYNLVGKEDKVAVLTLAKASQAYKEYGKTITVVFLYTQAERENLDKVITTYPLPDTMGSIKVKYLGNDIDRAKQKRLTEYGLNSEDIISIFPSPWPSDNLFHSKEKRSIGKIEIPVNQLPKGRDLIWMYGYKKQLINSGIGMYPEERSFYLALKLYFEKDKIKSSEASEIYEDDEIREAIKFELLGIKHQTEEITPACLCRR